MAGTQASRQRLYRELGELLSQESTDELMDAIPPVGWGDIARRQDVTNLEHTLRAEMAELRGEARTEFAESAPRWRSWRRDAHRVAAVRTEMAELRGEMRTEFAAVRTEMADMRSDLTSAMRFQIFSLLGAMFTLAGLTWAATSIT